MFSSRKNTGLYQLSSLVLEYTVEHSVYNCTNYYSFYMYIKRWKSGGGCKGCLCV